MWMISGLPGKLKALMDRLTATRAANLDNLNATVSSRAAAATALSNAVWTDSRAAKLDQVNSSPIDLAPIAGGLIPGDERSTGINSAGIRYLGTAPYSVTLVSVTGKGVVNYFALSASSTSTITITATIDGVAHSITVVSSAGSTKSRVLIGDIGGDADSMIFDQIPFNQSLVLSATATGTGTSNIYYKYRRVA